MFLLRLIHALEKEKVDYALVGGFAVALHGAVRGTVDVDLVITLSELSYIRAERALMKLGLVPRLPVQAVQVYQFREEYIQNRNLIAWSFYHPQSPSEVVDIILTHDLSKMKKKKIHWKGQGIQLLSIPDLIEMKKKSARPQDLIDIEALELIQRKDVKRKGPI